MLRVFLSHSSKDKAFVRRLSEELATYRVEVWLDERELRIGDPLSNSLRRGVAASKYFVVVVSANSIGSSWVREEILLAQEYASRTRLVPILLGDVPREDLERLIGDCLFADFSHEDLFFVSLAKLLRTMGLQRRFNDMLAQFGRIDPFVTRPIGIDEINLGREVLIELSHQPTLDVPDYRNWLFWEILRHHLRGVYPIELCVGTAADGEACCTLRDPMLNRAASVRLSPSQSLKGVWDFELGVRQRKDLRPTTRQKPKASPDRVVTHLGLPDVAGGSEEALNPWTLTGCDQELDCLLRDTCERLEKMGTEVTRSLLIDFGLVTFGSMGMARLRFGEVDFPEDSMDGSCARGRSLRSTCRIGNGSLLTQISAPFFASTNLIILCGDHRAGELRVRVDVFHSGENQILDTGPPKLGTG